MLGGGLSNMVQLYTGLSALVGLYTFSDGIDTPIARAAHGDSSGVRGAARLWSNPRGSMSDFGRLLTEDT